MLDHRRIAYCGLSGRIVSALLFGFVLNGAASAQSQSIPPPPTKQSQAPAPAKKSTSAPHKTFTNDSVKALPPGAVTQFNPSVPPLYPVNDKARKAAAAKKADDEAKQAAYWKARFTAARQKLADDQKALPGLQSALGKEQVEEYSVDECTGQVYSDRYMELLGQINATKAAIQQDKQALSDLYDQFHKSGGLPGWIRK